MPSPGLSTSSSNSWNKELSNNSLRHREFNLTLSFEPRFHSYRRGPIEAIGAMP